MTNLPERPFFIIGHPRSGTTLLRFMLASHPRLFVPEETGFIPFLVKEKEINAPLSRFQVSQILERIGKLNYLWRDKVKDVEGFYKSLPEPILASVLDEIFRHYTSNQVVIRWGDKTPLYVQYVRVISKIFPNAQFIHLIRDGRDAALSARKKWSGHSAYMDLHYLLKNWVRNVNTGRQAGKWLGESRYYELFYERLVTNPRDELGSLCTFLGETLHPAMLDHTVLASEVGPGPDGHTEVLGPVSTSSIAGWKKKMTPFEQKLSDRVAGSTLTSLDYELAGLMPFDTKELLRYWALSTKFTTIDSVRSLLYASGILTLNRTMRKG
jgi:hypothetical protein